MSPVIVIGAGPVGCLCALMLAQKYPEVVVYEKRADPRRSASTDLRLINMAISARGIRALESVDPAMATRVLSGMIPMHGRMVHPAGAAEQLQAYGVFGEAINLMSRQLINDRLLDECDRVENILVVFGETITGLTNTLDGVEVAVGDRSVHGTFVVGCDGAFSRTRTLLQRHGRFNYSQEYIDCTYLELRIPPGPNGFALNPNHLHIWPRDLYMLIALPNEDKLFTLTFFAPWGLADQITGDNAVEFFQEHFPDALELLGEQHVAHVFANHPRGLLMQVHLAPFNLGEHAVVLGDAAHSMVPFYGQGLNCGWEDVRVLLECLDKGGFAEYLRVRKGDTDAILELALANFKEMSHSVVDPLYLVRKKVDEWLCWASGGTWWVPLYTMVSFRSDLGYREVIARETRQQRVVTGGTVAVAAAAVAAAVLRWRRA